MEKINEIFTSETQQLHFINLEQFGACKICAKWNWKTEGNEEAKEDECEHL